MFTFAVQYLEPGPEIATISLAAVRAIDVAQAEDIAREALTLSSAGAVRELLHRFGESPAAAKPPNP